MNNTNLNNDGCSYIEKLKRSVGPGLYSVNVPYNDCNNCNNNIPNDPYFRIQRYGQNACTMNKAVDDNSELLGLNYKNSKCNADNYLPNKYVKTGCDIRLNEKPRDCKFRPVEDTRLSNPPCTLKEAGINRWQYLFYNPQERAIEGFDRIPVNVKNLFKDNHVPCIEKMEDVMKFYPNNGVGTGAGGMDDGENMLKKWSDINKGNKSYQVGNPLDDNINYNLKCNTNINNF